MNRPRPFPRPLSRHTSRAHKVGLSPGSVVYTGTRRVEQQTIEVMQYDGETLLERPDLDLDNAVALPTPERVTWLNIIGLHETGTLERLGEAFGLHPLTVEDIASVGQRPKLEGFDDYLYIVLRMLRLDNGRVEQEQISLVLGRNVLLTFQEHPGDVFEPVRERIRQNKGRIRKLDADYLAYTLIDVIIDNYFIVLEHLSDELELLEEHVFADPGPSVPERINQLKREMLSLRKVIWPLRELMAGLQREESSLLSRTVLTFLRDAYDHAIQAIDTVETLRDMLSGLQDAYLSSVSLRMNEVMKVLTIIATIFIPLSFLVGVYGMNFDVMPELHFRYGYFVLWGVMLAITAGMLLYFRRRKWL